jgi:Ca2+-binding RTX toxin-like protein
MLDQRRDPETGEIVLEGGEGSDHIQVLPNPDGGVIVRAYDSNHQEIFSRSFSAEEAQHLRIEGGQGDDQIAVSQNVHYGVHIEGGEGDDSLWGGSGNDEIRGGAGDDLIDGGLGADEFELGQGFDTVYRDADDLFDPSAYGISPLCEKASPSRGETVTYCSNILFRRGLFPKT